jgi:hypothetical protein
MTQRTPARHTRSGTRCQSGPLDLDCHRFRPSGPAVPRCGPCVAGFTRYRNRASPESLMTRHDSTLPPHPLQRMRNIRPQRDHARATPPPLPSPAHHMATMAKASVTSARALNWSLVDARAASARGSRVRMPGIWILRASIVASRASWERHLSNLLGGGPFGHVWRELRQRGCAVSGVDDPPHLVSAADTGAERPSASQRTVEPPPGGDCDAALIRSVRMDERESSHLPRLACSAGHRYRGDP